MGFMPGNGAGQHAASWFIRSHPNVIKAFKDVWQTDEQLLTSMDTMICWRPWMADARGKEHWTPRVENLHVDQNPAHKRGKHGVQGMIPLYPVTKEVGGLQVVPRSNTDATQDDLREQYPWSIHYDSDWIPFTITDKHVGTGKLLLAEPGSLILWDSRTIHGGFLGVGPFDPTGNELLRLTMKVSMLPFSRWDRAKEPDLLRLRTEAVEQGVATSCWPHEFRKQPFT